MPQTASFSLSAPLAIVVMGVSGCGKSSVGAAIARHYGVEFIEGDALHPAENVAKMARGTPLDDDDRWPWLDRIGAEIHAALASGKGLVVSCSSLRKAYRNRLRRAADDRLVFVFLEGSEDLLAGRMAARSGHFMPVSLLKSQFATLESPKGEPLVLTVDIAGSTSEVIAMALLGLEELIG